MPQVRTEVAGGDVVRRRSREANPGISGDSAGVETEITLIGVELGIPQLQLELIAALPVRLEAQLYHPVGPGVAGLVAARKAPRRGGKNFAKPVRLLMMDLGEDTEGAAVEPDPIARPEVPVEGVVVAVSKLGIGCPLIRDGGGNIIDDSAGSVWPILDLT